MPEGPLPERPGPGGSRPVGLARNFRRFRRSSPGDSGDSGASGTENPDFRSPEKAFPGRISAVFSRFSTASVLEQFKALQNWLTLTKHRDLRCFMSVGLHTHEPNKNTHSDKHRRRIAPTLRCKWVVRTTFDFFAPGRDLASILVASAHSWTLPGASLGVPGCPW